MVDVDAAVVELARDGVVAPQVVIDAGHDPSCSLRWFHTLASGRTAPGADMGPTWMSSLGVFDDGWHIQMDITRGDDGEPVAAKRWWYTPSTGIQAGAEFATEEWKP